MKTTGLKPLVASLALGTLVVSTTVRADDAADYAAQVERERQAREAWQAQAQQERDQRDREEALNKFYQDTWKRNEEGQKWAEEQRRRYYDSLTWEELAALTAPPPVAQRVPELAWWKAVPEGIAIEIATPDWRGGYLVWPRPANPVALAASQEAELLERDVVWPKVAAPDLNNRFVSVGEVVWPKQASPGASAKLLTVGGDVAWPRPTATTPAPSQSP